MFHGIKLTRSSAKPAAPQPPMPKGSDPASGGSSSHAHPQLAARNSPGTGPGTMAPRGNHLLKRSDAMSPQAQAHAQAAVPERRVQFATDASVVQSGVRVGGAPVEFGAKTRPGRAAPHHPSPSVAAPPPEPSPPTQPAQASRTSAPLAGTLRSPAEKFSGRLSSFMGHCPEGTLKRTLRSYLAQGNFQGFKKEVIKTLSEHRAPNQEAHEAMMLMSSSLRKMSDFSGVPLQEYVASSPLQPAATLQRTPAEKFSERLTKFMGQCPEGPLRRTLQLHVAAGNFHGFKDEVMKALTEHKAPTQGAYEALVSMNSSLRKMSDFSGVQLHYTKTAR